MWEVLSVPLNIVLDLNNVMLEALSNICNLMAEHYIVFHNAAVLAESPGRHEKRSIEGDQSGVEHISTAHTQSHVWSWFLFPITNNHKTSH